MPDKMISIRVEVDGVGEKVYKDKGLNRKEAISRFMKDFDIASLDDLRHYPRCRLVPNGKNTNKKTRSRKISRRNGKKGKNS